MVEYRGWFLFLILINDLLAMRGGFFVCLFSNIVILCGKLLGTDCLIIQEKVSITNYHMTSRLGVK